MRQVDTESEGDRAIRKTANALALSGLMGYTQGNFESSVPSLQEAVSLYEQLHGETDSRATKLKQIIDLILLESKLAGADADEEAIAVRKQLNSAE